MAGLNVSVNTSCGEEEAGEEAKGEGEAGRGRIREEQGRELDSAATADAGQHALPEPPNLPRWTHLGANPSREEGGGAPQGQRG